MPRATACKVKVYNIFINGQFVDNSFGENTTQAIAFYAKQRGIKLGKAQKMCKESLPVVCSGSV